MGIGGGSSCGGVKSEKKCKQKAVKKIVNNFFFGKKLISKQTSRIDPFELIKCRCQIFLIMKTSRSFFGCTGS